MDVQVLFNCLYIGDGYHLTRPMENGEGGLLAMEKALEDSNL